MPTKSDHGEIGDVEPLADSTANQARRVVAAYANDADECRVFLSMLGIGPATLDASWLPREARARRVPSAGLPTLGWSPIACRLTWNGCPTAPRPGNAARGGWSRPWSR